VVNGYIAYNPRLKQKLIEKYNNLISIMMRDLSSYDFIEIKHQNYDHNDNETGDIDTKFENESYVALVNEKLDISLNRASTYGFSLIDPEIEFERFYKEK
jgi:hypothetical protein